MATTTFSSLMSKPTFSSLMAKLTMSPRPMTAKRIQQRRQRSWRLTSKSNFFKMSLNRLILILILFPDWKLKLILEYLNQWLRRANNKFNELSCSQSFVYYPEEEVSSSQTNFLFVSNKICFMTKKKIHIE